MRQLKILLVTLLCLCYSSLAYALPKNIGEDELNIGGITLGASLDYVEKVYGAPTKKTAFNDLYVTDGMIYNYNNLFIVAAYKTKSGGTWISDIIIKEPGLKTPSGFEVGQPFKKVKEKYSHIKPLDKQEVRSLKLPSKYTYYEYRCGANFMRFTVDKKGIIQEISCWWMH